MATGTLTSNGIAAPSVSWLPGAQSSPVRRSARRIVLVVDDDRDNRDMLCLLLDLAGHEVHSAGSARQALRLCDRFLPDTFFIDIIMPGGDGYELCRTLRERPGSRDAAIYALSGFHDAGHRHRCEAAGFTATLLKPADPLELLRLMR